MIIEPQFDPTEVEAVRREMLTIASRAGDSPSGAAAHAFRRVLTGNSFLIGGTEATINAIDGSVLRTFHRGYFAPQNIVVTIVSALPAQTLQEVAGRLFSAKRWPMMVGPYRSWDPAETAPLRDTQPRRESLSLGQAQSWLTMGYAFDYATRDEGALRVAGWVLSDRMAFELREREGLAYSIGANFGGADGFGTLRLSMGTRSENLKKAEEGMVAELTAITRAEIPPEDIEAVVASRTGRVRMRQITRIGQAYQLSMNVLAGGELGAHQARLERLTTVTPEDVSRVASKYFSAERLHRVVVN